MPDYDSTWHPLVVTWMARSGLDAEQIAVELGLTKLQLEDWQKRYPELDGAVKSQASFWRGIALDSLMKLAKGYVVEEQEAIIVGIGESAKRRLRTKRRHIPPDSRAAMFLIENDPLFKMFKEG